MSRTGEISEIWRFPVKSMRGELLNRCSVGYKGLVGDRGWAIRDDEAGEVRGGRNLPELLNSYARYLKSPQAEPYPPAMITLPDGEELMCDDEAFNAKLSKILGKRVSIWPILPEEKLDHYKRLPADIAEVRRLFAREEGEPLPDMRDFPEHLRDYVSPPGTYFDAYPIHILTTSTLRYVKSLNPESDWRTERFRPNFVIDTGDEPSLIENSWIGKTLNINGVELTCIRPAPRCAMTAHPQGSDIEKDPKVLRTIVKDADQNLGIYCEVKTTGQVNTGDTVDIY